MRCPDSLLTLITLFARFVRCFPSQCGMRTVGSIGGRYLVSATKRWGYPRTPLWCLRARQRSTVHFRLLVRCMRPSPDLESSTHTNTPTPQLRKKRNKHMKGQFIVVSSLVLTLPFDMLRLHPAAASRLPRAPDPRPACPGLPPRAAPENVHMVFARSALSTLL